MSIAGHPAGTGYGSLYRCVADGLGASRTVPAGAGAYALMIGFSDPAGTAGHVGETRGGNLLASVAADGITVVEAGGVYLASFNGTFNGENATANNIYRVQFRVNAAAPAHPNIIECEYTTQTDGNDRNVASMHGYLNLEVGDEVTVWIASLPANADAYQFVTGQFSLLGPIAT